MSDGILRKTALYERHVEHGARFTEFGGWDMPVQYTGVIDEHNAVRNSVGIFDVSHMGEIFVEGPEAREYLQRVTTNDIEKLKIGKAQYSLLCNEQGGVVDDIIVYQLAEEKYLVCVNASNADKDFAWLVSKNKSSAVIENRSADYGQIAVQGPKAELIFAEIFNADFSLESFPAFTQKTFNLSQVEGELLVARTGYTGEDGFEVFLPVQSSVALWDVLVEAGKKFGIKPAGLGARDTLRLEASYPLYGHELTGDIVALCSGVGWVIKLKKGDFIGRDALLEAKKVGLKWKLTGYLVKDKGIIREGAKIYANNREVGWVASGTKTPTLNAAIAMGFIERDLANSDELLEAEVRGRRLAVETVKTTFL